MSDSIIKFNPEEFEINGTVLTKYKGEGNYVKIPEGVTEIGEKVFFHNYVVEEVSLPDSLTKIGDLAFTHCHKLKNITIPAGVTEIGNAAFYRCYYLKRATIYGKITRINAETFDTCRSLSSVTLPETLREIGTTAFQLCPDLKKINLPSSLESIEKCAFTGSGLVSIFIPAGVKKIANRAFSQCWSLTQIACEAKEKPEGWDDGFVNVPELPIKTKVIYKCKRKA